MIYIDKTEYLQSPRGLYGRYHWRILRGRTHYSFKDEPKSKNSMKAKQKLKFQEKLLKKMRKAKRRSYRAPIIAEMSFETTSSNPPHIHTLVKNYQDLFGRILDDPKKRKALVYLDDRLIYGLSVRYHVGGKKPHIRTSFRPFRDFLLDLDLVNEIVSGHFSDNYGYYDLREQIAEFKGREDDSYYDSIDDLRDHIQNKDKFIKNFGKKAYESMLMSHRLSAQEHLLKGGKLSVNNLYLFYMPLIMEKKYGKRSSISKSNNEWEKIPDITSEWIAKSPIRIHLPDTPLLDGESYFFKQQVKESIEQFHKDHQIFKPLHIPINLNILYKAPKNSQSDYNDLDNIMREIVIAFNEIFEPPTTHVSHLNLEDIKDRKLYKSLKDMQDRIPKSIRTSIVGYDIFKMPRDSDDDTDGYLTASFTSGISSLSFPTLIMDRIIYKWIECCDD